MVPHGILILDMKSREITFVNKALAEIVQNGVQGVSSGVTK